MEGQYMSPEHHPCKDVANGAACIAPGRQAKIGIFTLRKKATKLPVTQVHPAHRDSSCDTMDFYIDYIPVILWIM